MYCDDSKKNTICNSRNTDDPCWHYLLFHAGRNIIRHPVHIVIPFIFGLAMVIDGIGRIIAWFSIREYAPQSGWVLASSIISLVFGLMLVTSPMLQLSVGVFVVLLTGWWILALGIIRIVHAFHLLKIKRESPDFAFGEMVGSNWWVALILGLLLGVLGVIVILNPLLGLGVIGVVVGCGMITAGINLIFLSTNVWLW